MKVTMRTIEVEIPRTRAGEILETRSDTPLIPQVPADASLDEVFEMLLLRPCDITLDMWDEDSVYTQFEFELAPGITQIVRVY